MRLEQAVVGRVRSMVLAAVLMVLERHDRPPLPLTPGWEVGGRGGGACMKPAKTQEHEPGYRHENCRLQRSGAQLAESNGGQHGIHIAVVFTVAG